MFVAYAHGCQKLMLLYLKISEESLETSRASASLGT